VDGFPQGRRITLFHSRRHDTTGTARGSGQYTAKYFETRLAPNPNRAAVWKHICEYLRRWIPTDSVVLELGAGWCDFANNVSAARVVAVDVDKTVLEASNDHVTAIVGDGTDLHELEDASFDVVFASNLLEHLDRHDSSRVLAEARRVLRSGGRLILLQPNFRLNPGGYFDDFTHVSIFTDRSLADYLTSEGWTVEHVAARFLPLTMKSRASALSFLVPLYLRSPIKPRAGQMLVIATR
jgi:ubiquinone/menaquinone biosynthesis C-methylase UbiE